MESKYLHHFQKAEGKIPINGNRLLVEVLPEEEMKVGSLIIAKAEGHRNKTDTQRPKIAIVLATGKGYYDDETGEDVALDSKPGDIVFLPATGQYALSYLSYFPGLYELTTDTLALIDENQIVIRWTQEEYKAYKAAIQS